MTLDDLRQYPRPVPVRWHAVGGWHWGRVIDIERSPNGAFVAIVEEGDCTIRKYPKSIVVSEPGEHP